MKLKNLYDARVTLAVLLTVSGIGTAEAQRYQTRYGNATLTFDTGDGNSAFGEQALHYNTTGEFNTATGFFALDNNRTGSWNTAYGGDALFLNTSGDYNSAFGESALARNDTGNHNIAIGDSALYGNLSGIRNVAVGSNALNNNGIGKFNNATGYDSLRGNTSGSYNSASGYSALFSNTTGSSNIAVGPFAGYYPTTGSNNIEIGNRGAPADNAVIRIGKQGTQTATYLAGVSGVNVTGGTPVVVNANGRLGVVSSSRRYKQDIRSMGDLCDRLLNLRPVIFRYRQSDDNGQRPEQYGLIAEEVAKVMPELVVYNEKGQPETVAYQTLAPLLLNELQREHKQMAALKSQLADMNALRAEVTELRRLTTQVIAKQR